MYALRVPSLCRNHATSRTPTAPGPRGRCRPAKRVQRSPRKRPRRNTVTTRPSEIELKLLVAGLTAEEALKRLRRLPALAGRPCQERWLINRYMDTDDQRLAQARAALRLRWTGEQTPDRPDATGTWTQTLKTAGVSRGGLSQRGEWNADIPAGKVSRAALKDTAWDEWDPEGHWFKRLTPCFQTTCHRVTWQVRRRDGTEIEVAFDTGWIEAGERRAPILELELELLAGEPVALFALARQLARRVPCMPYNPSKAERGYRLAAGVPLRPVKARPQTAPKGATVADWAVPAMTEMLDQFTRNLAGLIEDDDPEWVHQARVAWRRWRSMQKLLRPWVTEWPDLQGLRPMLEALGRLRDLDVAAMDTLPRWQAGWTGEPDAWDQAVDRLQQARTRQRVQARQMLLTPVTAQALLDMAHTLWTGAPTLSTLDTRHVMHRLTRWRKDMVSRVRGPRSGAPDIADLHEARLIAKRVRYVAEVVVGTLSTRKARTIEAWMSEATTWQTRIGEARDARQAALCLQDLDGSEAMVQYLMGIATAMEHAAQPSDTPR